MTKTKTITRRAALTGLAGLPMLGMVTAFAAEPAMSPMVKLIARHQAASDNLSAVTERFQFDSRDAGDIPEWEAANRRERLACMLLCSFTCKSHDDERRRAQHLLSRIEPVNFCDFEQRGLLTALIRAIAYSGAAA